MNETKNRKYRSIKVGSLKVSMKFTNLHLGWPRKKRQIITIKNDKRINTTGVIIRNEKDYMGTLGTTV